MEAQNLIPVPRPSFPGLASTSLTPTGCSYVSTAPRDLWDHLFDEAYKADVFINTCNGGILFAHSNVLGMASPVLKGMLKQASPRRGQRSISILGVPHDAVRVFVRFLYSSWSFKQKISYQRKKDEMKWKILVQKILREKGIAVAPIFQQQ